MTRVYYRDAVGAVVVYDVTRADTFPAAERWKDDLDAKVLLPDGRPVPAVLVGNKCDQEKSGPAAEEAAVEAMVRNKGFLGHFAASARDGINVDESAAALIEVILENDKKFGASRGAVPVVGRPGGYSGEDGPNVVMIDERGERRSGAKGDCKC